MEQNTPRAEGSSSQGETAAVRDKGGRPLLIVNADDWGLDAEVTARTLDCFRAGAISTVGAMVFMEVSQEAAAQVREHGMDAGLHLNLTTAFTGEGVSTALREHQRKVISYLRRRRMHRAIFNPLLTQSFEYVVKAQLEEFARLYGAAPSHVNGHHHMHLCANVLRQKLLPTGSVVRRSKSLFAGEASLANRCLREVQKQWMRRRYRTTDYFFDLTPLRDNRLTRILNLARAHNVEVSVHADNADEYRFLMSGRWNRYAEGVVIARGYQLREEPAREKVDGA